MRTLSALPLLALALLAAPASAQASFGIKAGVNAANVSFGDDGFDDFFGGEGVEKQARLGFVAGLTADVPISPSLSFRPEILYSQKGYAISVDTEILGEAFEGTLTQEVDYLEVPLLLAFQIPASSGLGFSLEAGPTVGYKLSTGYGCSGVFEEEDCGDPGEEDGLRDLDLGGALGATVGAGPFHVGLRYTQSLLSIADEEAVEDEDASVRNQVFTVVGVYRFGR